MTPLREGSKGEVTDRSQRVCASSGSDRPRPSTARRYSIRTGPFAEQPYPILYQDGLVLFDERHHPLL